ncbi:MAG: HD-GYP domain-containing protein [Bacillota bacterium]
MLFNLNDFLRAVSNTLDVIEADIFGVSSNHSKRIAYISLMIANELNLTGHEIFDLVSLSILHDNGASLKVLHDRLRGSAKEKLDMLESMQEHCLIGEENVTVYPFLTHPKDVIKYHHERYDGSGFFNLSGEAIPLMAQIISFSDTLDLHFDLKNIHKEDKLKDNVINFVCQQQNKYFSPVLVNAFLEIVPLDNFWIGLSDASIDDVLITYTPSYNMDFTYAEIHDITKTFSRIIDAKSQFTQQHSSGLAEKLERMALFYDFAEEVTLKLLIAADLHDLGKLAIKNEILDKPGRLSKEEFEEIKKHAAYTRTCLQEIRGFEDITEWACNHHERLNGSGYPRGLSGNQIDFYSRLVACLDIYQALTEVRPYRSSVSHKDAMVVLNGMAEDKLIDAKIVADIAHVFSEK